MPKKITKPARATYTDELRAEALDIYREHGPTETSRRCGVPARTITRWATKDRVATEVTGKTAAAVEQAELSLETRKQELAGRLLSEIGGLLDQLHEPMVERKIIPLRGRMLRWLGGEGEPVWRRCGGSRPGRRPVRGVRRRREAPRPKPAVTRPLAARSTGSTPPLEACSPSHQCGGADTMDSGRGEWWP